MEGVVNEGTICSIIVHTLTHTHTHTVYPGDTTSLRKIIIYYFFTAKHAQGQRYVSRERNASSDSASPQKEYAVPFHFTLNVLNLPLIA